MVCNTFQQGIAVHSSGELGIQLATMLHLGAVLLNLVFTADAHNHRLRDDIIKGGRMQYSGRAIKFPSGPGLVIELDREKLAEYSEYCKRHGALSQPLTMTRILAARIGFPTSRTREGPIQRFRLRMMRCRMHDAFRRLVYL